MTDPDDVVEDHGDEVEIETDEAGNVEELPPVGEGEPVTTTTATEET
ncbi:MAG TPA: hypothetical protein VHJ78_11700 [Actinomycetota bacterium]|nr:hypothetical protein [Actinomycetota bacterium]